MKERIVFVFVALVVFAAPAAAETIEARSEAGLFIIRVQTEPSRPAVGSNVVTLTILDGNSGSPLEGLKLEVVPWMTVHSHGSTKKTRIREKGKGLYTVEDVYFTMAGDWDLLITIRKDGVEDKALILFKNLKT